MASVLEVEDEPEETDAFNSLHEHARLEELARRNTLCLPHLRSVYPLEVFSTDEEVGGLSKDVSRSSSMAEGRRRDPSGSSIVGGGASKESSVSSVSEGRMKDLSGPNVVEGHFKETARSRPSSAASLPAAHSELVSQENIKHKVNVIVDGYHYDCHGNLGGGIV